MQTPPRDQVAAALADLIQEALIEGKTLHIPGLGTFSTEHQSSEVVEEDDQILMKPPRNNVVFSPEEPPS